ncbi:MAG: precorrin-6A reductase [Pseudomonadota bacterium]
MILLLGGTSESVFLASHLADQGYPVLVSTASDIPIDLENHPLIHRRDGDLNEEGLIRLIRSEGIRAVVDATHPYAQKISDLAQKTALTLALPYLLWDRPSVVPRDKGFWFAKNHDEGARLAFSVARPVLLTTGSRHLDPYVDWSRQTGIPLLVRVLFHPGSVEACRRAGLEENGLIFGRGPFSVEDNKKVIKEKAIGVLVTKDSGLPGGVLDKLEAARQEHCQVVVIERPQRLAGKGFHQIEDLLTALRQALT